MTTDVTDLLSKLGEYQPLRTYHFGHTPLQMSSFKTTQQQGCETFEYWHQVLQLRGLKDALEEMQIQSAEVQDEITECTSLWPVWSLKKRRKKIPRLQFQLKKIERNIAEKSREAAYHFDLLKTRYKHLETLTEAEIFAKDSEYWEHRLSKQVAIARISRKIGVGEGELAAILALPPESRQKIFQNVDENRLLLDEKL
jgi:hypothetical protein